MRQINIILDLYSSVICFLCISYIYFSKMKKDRRLKYFKAICLFNIGMTAGDMTNWTCEGFGQPWYPAALWAGSLLSYVCTGPIILAFVGYVLECIPPGLAVPKAYWRAAAFFCGAQVSFSVLSLWNGMYFTVGEGNLYQRGNLFWLSQIIPLLMYLLVARLILRYRRPIGKKDVICLFSYILLPFMAELVQILNYGAALLNTGITLSILLLFINIQLDRELRMQRQEKELIQARVDIMLSQIQPHFLYNTLTAIRRLCDTDPRQAKEALSDFSMFLRRNMDSLHSKDPIPFVQELLHVKNYLRLEKRRFQNRLDVIYDIHATDFCIPPLTIQPIVENALRHGILKREEGGVIMIHTEETDTHYIITVSDNGVGFWQRRAADRRAHIGIENVRGRLSALCGGALDIQGREGGGTVATISIPRKEASL